MIHLNVGIFFNIVLFLLLFATLSFFQVVSLLFVSIFIFSKKIICFIFIFRGDRLSNGFAQKAPARVFLQKLQRRRGTTESNQHIFFHFFGFFIYFMCIYVFIIYLGCFFTILYRFTIFLGFFLFFSCLICFSLKLCIKSTLIKEHERRMLAHVFACNQSYRKKNVIRFLLPYSFLNKIIFLPLTMNQKNQKTYFKSKNIISSNSSERHSSKLSQRYEINLFLFCSFSATTNFKEQILCVLQHCIEVGSGNYSIVW